MNDDPEGRTGTKLKKHISWPDLFQHLRGLNRGWGIYHPDPYQLYSSRLLRQLRTSIVLRVSHTSRIGTCSSNLLSHRTEMFDAERKNSAAAISNNPAFRSKNAGAFQCHRSERLRRDRSADLVCRKWRCLIRNG